MSVEERLAAFEKRIQIMEHKVEEQSEIRIRMQEQINGIAHMHENLIATRKALSHVLDKTTPPEIMEEARETGFAQLNETIEELTKRMGQIKDLLLKNLSRHEKYFRFILDGEESKIELDMRQTIPEKKQLAPRPVNRQPGRPQPAYDRPQPENRQQPYGPQPYGQVYRPGSFKARELVK